MLLPEVLSPAIAIIQGTYAVDFIYAVLIDPLKCVCKQSQGFRTVVEFAGSRCVRPHWEAIALFCSRDNDSLFMFS